MLVVRLTLGILAGYLLLTGLLWLIQSRLAFPAPRAPLPDPVRAGLPDAEPLTLAMRDGTRLAGWYLPPGPSSPFPALLWFYGNSETIAAIAPVLRDFRPPGTAVLIVDYPGYGASEGRASEPGLYEAAELAYDTLLERPGIDPARVFVYGRSLGSAVAAHVASTRTPAGLVLESPFTSARDMARRHYPLFPAALLRVRLDNLAALSRVRCPVLVIHGTADRLVPIDMGHRLAAAAPGGVEFVTIAGAGHNDSYGLGGRAYRERVWEFLKMAGDEGRGTRDG
ncbi:MAG TPA: alpha/beta fold hydrolase [Gemmatimonadales bacterium]|nr:alpha/beta fold hydrolase [Gemmatimonadales bacterium]